MVQVELKYAMFDFHCLSVVWFQVKNQEKFIHVNNTHTLFSYISFIRSCNAYKWVCRLYFDNPFSETLPIVSAKAVFPCKAKLFLSLTFIELEA